MKKTLAGIIALSIVLSLSSCGDNDSTSEKKESSSVSVSAIDSDKNNDYDSSESVDDNNDYYDNEDYYYEDSDYDYQNDDSENYETSYYKDLSEEYSTALPVVHLRSDKFQYEIDGKIYRYKLVDWDDRSWWDDGDWENAGHDCYLESYDLKNDKYSEIKLFSSTQFDNSNYEDVVYYNGNIFALKEDRSDTSDSYSDIIISIAKYDLNGKLLSSYDVGEYDDEYHYKIAYITEDESVLLDESGSKTSGDKLIVTSDFKDHYVLSKPTVEIKHGIGEERPVHIFSAYNNELYGTIQRQNGDQTYAVVKYNISSKTWSEPLYDLNGTDNGQVIGKYVYNHNNDEYSFFDIETGLSLAFVNTAFDEYMTVNNTSKSEEFAKWFKFGDTHILKDGSWHEIRIHGDGSTSYDDINSALGYDSSDAFFVSVVNDKYYVIDDNYGCFLRSFDNGESDEKTIVLYDE